MAVLTTIVRRAWRAACAASLLACLIACLGACLLWARADGTHRDRMAVAVPGRYASVAWFQGGVTVATIGGWPGTWGAWVGPDVASGPAFKVVEMHPWQAAGGRFGGLAGTVRVALGPDGRPVDAARGADGLAWDAGTPSAPLRVVQAAQLPHWGPAALFAVPPAAWLVRALRRRHRLRAAQVPAPAVPAPSPVSAPRKPVT